MTRAPLRRGGEHSAAKTGVVELLGPIPRPRANYGISKSASAGHAEMKVCVRRTRAMNICHQLFKKVSKGFSRLWESVTDVFVKACQKHARAEITQAMKTVPRRPKTLFMGSVNQQPINAQQRYGAEFTKPTSQVSRDASLPMPNSFL